MSMITGVAVAVIISALFATLLYMAIAGPLRSLLRRTCPNSDAVRFWQRFTLVMLYLLPILLAIVFGAPSMERAGSTGLGSVIIHSAIASLVGGFIVLAVMGRWVRMLSQNAPDQSTAQQADDQNEPSRTTTR